MSIFGLKIPDPLAKVGDQVPPDWGVPLRLSNRLYVLVSSSQRSKTPFSPASGGGIVVIVTEAEASPQAGFVLATVYV